MPRVPRLVMWFAHNIDWLGAIVVVAGWLLHDQGLLAIGDHGAESAPVRVGGETLTALGALVMVLRAMVERRTRKSLQEAQ